MSYLPDFNFNSRIPLDRSYFISQRYDPNNLPPLTILQDAFNKYIASNNNNISEVCLMVEYKQTTNGRIKTMFITKDRHSDINAEFYGENPDDSTDPLFQLVSGRRSGDSRYYSVNSYSDFASDISNFNILSITLCEVYDERWVTPIKVLYLNRPNNYESYHRFMGHVDENDNYIIGPGHQLGITQFLNTQSNSVVIPSSYERSRNAARNAYHASECPICLSSLEDGEDVCITIPCHHLFHCGCISQVRNNRCPVCRQNINSIEQVPPEDVEALVAEAYREEAGLTLFGNKRVKVVKKSTKPKMSKSGKIKLPNNKKSSKSLKGYNTKPLGATVAVRINDKIRQYRLIRIGPKNKRRGPGTFKVMINKVNYSFKSKGPGTMVTLHKMKSTSFGKKNPVKIPSKIKKLAKKLKIKLSYKKNGKRVLKSLKMVKKQIKLKVKNTKRKN